MKEHAKKALKHDVEVLGKTVPTIAVVALFLIGSGSAAVLTEFGTVEGTATVDAAILMNGQADYDNSESLADTTSGGATASDAYTLTNRANESIPISLAADTQIYDSSSEDASVVESDPEGVNTSFVYYTLKTASDSSDYSMQVDVITDQSEVEEGNYDLRISGENTKDYATVWYPTDLSSGTTVKAVNSTGSGHEGGSVVDEAYVVTESGDLYFSMDKDLSTVYSEETQNQVDTSNLDVAMIGLGVGNADRDSKVTKNVTISEVSVGGESLSETGQDIKHLPLTPTGQISLNAGGTQINVNSTQKFQTVTDFSNGFLTQDDNEVRVETTAEIK
ncbi:MAG: hypothetical protein ACI8Z7_000782 [Candidatus Nanohaloarchaea archaeon]|jgi:hypothetical protein